MLTLGNHLVIYISSGERTSPFSTMKFQPTQQEQNQGIAHSVNGSPDLNSLALALSGCKWEDAHLKGHRVVLLDRIPLQRLFPSEYLPSATHPGECLA